MIDHKFGYYDILCSPKQIVYVHCCVQLMVVWIHVVVVTYNYEVPNINTYKKLMRSQINWSTKNHIIFVFTLLNLNLSKDIMLQNQINHFVTSCYKEKIILTPPFKFNSLLNNMNFELIIIVQVVIGKIGYKTQIWAMFVDIHSSCLIPKCNKVLKILVFLACFSKLINLGTRKKVHFHTLLQHKQQTWCTPPSFPRIISTQGKFNAQDSWNFCDTS
jgi:hypothetical protein